MSRSVLAAALILGLSVFGLSWHYLHNSLRDSIAQQKERPWIACGISSSLSSSDMVRAFEEMDKKGWMCALVPCLLTSGVVIGGCALNAWLSKRRR